MIYIATVHSKSEKWIYIQNQYFEHFIKEDFRVFTFLNDLPNDHSHKFYYSSMESLESHPIKLNLLSELIIQNSENDEDWIIFIDGDAFPISDILEYGKVYLKKYPLIAVRRDEDDGGKQPHPCFCMTTVKFWKEIKGDWNKGYTWKNNRGKDITDVGGNLLGILQKREIDWHPLLRTNQKNLHPLLFGVYGDLVYHQGAGFRQPQHRIELYNASRIHKFIQRMVEKTIPQSVKYLIPPIIRATFHTVRKSIKLNRNSSEKVYNSILEDFYFFKYFLAENTETKALKYFKNSHIKIPNLCIIILGMHRSGSSCLTGILQDHGLYLERINEYNRFNLRGTRENTEINLLNDDVLEFNSGSWFSPPCEIKWNNKLAKRRDRIIRRISLKACGGAWGFKDPRTLITLPFWMEGLDRVKLIATYRNPTSVANSLALRDEISLTTSEGHKLWKVYNIKLLLYISKWEFPLVSFDRNCIEYCIVLEKALTELGLQEFRPKSLDFYDESLIHFNTRVNEESMPKDVLEVYNRLNAIYEQQQSEC